MNRESVIFSAIFVEGGLAVSAYFLGNWWGYPPQEQLAISWLSFLWGAAAVIPMLLLMLWITHSRWRPWRRLTTLVRRQVAPLFVECSYLDLALISLLAGWGEEAMFRGVLQSGLTTWWGVWPALLATSVLFGLVHMLTPGYFLLATVFGALFGGLLLATNSLFAPIVAHALYDFLVLGYMMQNLPGGKAASADPTPTDDTSSEE